MLFDRRNWFPAALAVLVLAQALLPGRVPADTIVKKNGETLSGRVVKQDAVEVQLDTGPMVITLRRSEIKELKIEDNTRTASEAFAKAQRIRTLLNSGKLIEALTGPEGLKSAAKGKESLEQEYAPAARAAFSLCRTMMADASKRNRPDLLIQQVALLRDPDLLKAWKVAYTGEEYLEEVERPLLDFEGDAYLIRGKTAVESRANLDSARTDFARAKEILGPQAALGNHFVDVAKYRWSVFWQLRTLREQLQALPDPAQRTAVLNNFPEATLMKWFAEARRRCDLGEDPSNCEPGARTVGMESQLFEALAFEERWYREQRLIHTASVTPTPAPAAPVIVMFTPLPTPSPVPTPAPTPIVERSVADAFSDIKSGNFGNALDQFKRVASNGIQDFGGLLAYAFGAILVLIIAPRLLLRFLEHRGDIHAAHYRQHYNVLLSFFGLLAYIGVSLKNLRKTVKHRCPHCQHSLDDIESYKNLDFVSCPNCHQTISPIYDLEAYIEWLVAALTRELEAAKLGNISERQLIERDAMGKLVRAMLTLALRRRASDLHIEPEADSLRVRVRVDGMLQELTTMPKLLASPVVSAVKVLGNLDIAERRRSQDGRFSQLIDGHSVDIRLASAPAALGEKASLRFLDSRSVDLDPAKLGMDPRTREIFDRTILKPQGLLLVTGPTGSGKSTTLYVALNAINNGERNIISIEDPIEFKIKGVNQLQVNVQAKFTFASGLRSILRQDPDVIMIGEIRDEETAEICVESSMTGHLVLSTLHTNDATAAIPRLTELKVEPRRFGDALALVIAQRLVRTNCTQCLKPYMPKLEDLARLSLNEGDVAGWKLMKGLGCEKCRLTGFFGRVGIYEVLDPDDDLRRLIENRASTVDLRRQAMNSGMVLLREQGLIRASEGITTLEEVLRVTV